MKGMLISMGEKLTSKSPSLLDQYIVENFNCSLNLALITNEQLQQRFSLQKNVCINSPKLNAQLKEFVKVSTDELRGTERRMKDSCRRLETTYTQIK
jgi:hypothetical protein